MQNKKLDNTSGKLMVKHFMIHGAGHYSEECEVFIKCQKMVRFTALKILKKRQWKHYTRGKKNVVYQAVDAMIKKQRERRIEK